MRVLTSLFVFAGLLFGQATTVPDRTVKADKDGNVKIGTTVLSPTWVLVFPPITVSDASYTVAAAGDFYCDVAGGCTFVLPAITTAMVGAKFCFFQADTRSGALVLRAPANTAITVDGTAGSNGGTLTSPAAGSDAVCVKALSTTKYKAVPNTAWTPGA
jgi:hypothetical protein